MFRHVFCQPGPQGGRVNHDQNPDHNHRRARHLRSKAGRPVSPSRDFSAAAGASSVGDIGVSELASSLREWLSGDTRCRCGNGGGEMSHPGRGFCICSMSHLSQRWNGQIRFVPVWCGVPTAREWRGVVVMQACLCSGSRLVVMTILVITLLLHPMGLYPVYPADVAAGASMGWSHGLASIVPAGCGRAFNGGLS